MSRASQKLAVAVERHEQFWGEVGLRLLHPTQHLILEAFLRLDTDLSPTLLMRIFDEEGELGSWNYHCKRLAKLGLLVLVKQVPVRGTHENYYCLVE